MTQAEVKIKTGIDNTSIGVGLKDLSARVKAEVSSIKSNFEFFKASSIVDSVVSALTPMTEAISSAAGTWSAMTKETEDFLKGVQKYDKWVASIRKSLKAMWDDMARRKQEMKDRVAADLAMSQANEDAINKEARLERAMETLQNKKINAARIFGENSSNFRKAQIAYFEIEKQYLEAHKAAEEQRNTIWERRIKLQQISIDRNKQESRARLNNYMPGMDELATNAASPFQTKAKKYLDNQRKLEQMGPQIKALIAAGKMDEAKKLVDPLVIENEGGTIKTPDKWSKLSRLDQILHAKEKDKLMSHEETITGIKYDLQKAGAIKQDAAYDATIQMQKDVKDLKDTISNELKGN